MDGLLHGFPEIHERETWCADASEMTCNTNDKASVTISAFRTLTLTEAATTLRTYKTRTIISTFWGVHCMIINWFIKNVLWNTNSESSGIAPHNKTDETIKNDNQYPQTGMDSFIGCHSQRQLIKNDSLDQSGANWNKNKIPRGWH